VSDHYLTFLNNVFAGTEYARLDSGLAPRADSYAFDYDCWYTSATDRFFRIDTDAYPDLASYALATGMEQHGVQGEPQFVDPSAVDLRLGAQSPCRAAGVVIPGINDGFAGSVPDMGAYYDDDSIGPGGTGPGGAGGSGGTGADEGLSGTGNASGAGALPVSDDAGGCGCRVAPPNRLAGIGVLLNLLGVAARRRRGRRVLRARPPDASW
jgi:hypothetical protein